MGLLGRDGEEGGVMKRGETRKDQIVNLLYVLTSNLVSFDILSPSPF